MRRLVFWGALAPLAWAQAGYPLLMWALARSRRGDSVRERAARAPVAPTTTPEASTTDPPFVSLIIAAYREEPVIAARVRDARALDYPAERLEVVVAADGSPDRTAQEARRAGADLVLELPRAGKTRAQDLAVERARGEILAFSDANARWSPDALKRLVDAFEDPRVGYVCGRVSFEREAGRAEANQEGLYWRYEMALRGWESGLCSVTAGNGAIYAVRRAAYLRIDDAMRHDLSLPFTLVKRGWRAIDLPSARAYELMAPTLAGELARKRRMMRGSWRVVLRGGMLDPRGYPPLYALMVLSHRGLRYTAPFWHALALAANVTLLRRSFVYRVALAGQLVVALAAVLGRFLPWRPLLIARYYALVTAACALGLWDWWRQGPSAVWEPVEGTRAARSATTGRLPRREASNRP